MTVRCGDPDAERPFRCQRVRRFPAGLLRVMLRKLGVVDWRDGDAHEVEIVDYH